MDKYVRMILFGALLFPHHHVSLSHHIKTGSNPGARNVVIRVLIGRRPTPHVYHNNYLNEPDNPNTTEIPKKILKQMGFEGMQRMTDTEGRQIRGQQH